MDMVGRLCKVFYSWVSGQHGEEVAKRDILIYMYIYDTDTFCSDREAAVTHTRHTRAAMPERRTRIFPHTPAPLGRVERRASLRLQ